MRGGLHSRALLPLIPLPPSPTRGEGGLGVLMPETRDGTPGLSKKSTSVRWRTEVAARRVVALRIGADNAAVTRAAISFWVWSGRQVGRRRSPPPTRSSHKPGARKILKTPGRKLLLSIRDTITISDIIV